MILSPLEINLWIKEKGSQRPENVKKVCEQEEEWLEDLEDPGIVLRYWQDSEIQAVPGDESIYKQLNHKIIQPDEGESSGGSVEDDEAGDDDKVDVDLTVPVLQSVHHLHHSDQWQ